MGHLIELMVARLQKSAPNATWLPEIAFAGSMLEHVPLLRQTLVSVLQENLPHLQIRAGVVDPLLGALWRARQQAPTL
ncbi:MAG: hypothetical protein NVSMB3_05500 [Acidobacteriaceae bacterium]